MADTPTQRAIGRILKTGEAVVKFTVSKPSQPVRGWYDMPPKADFERALKVAGIVFMHDEAQPGTFRGVHYSAHRYMRVAVLCG